MSIQQGIPVRRLGDSGLNVSAMGLGCLSMSGTYGKSDDRSSLELIQFAIDSGVNFLDTADMYGWGHNEELVGRAIKGRRAVVATKFGQVKQADGSLGINGRPAHVAIACEASLQRLAIDVIDLYFLHRVDPNVPIEETVGAMADLVAQGKVRFLGLSEAHPGTIRRAHRVHPVAAVQSEYSLLYRIDAEKTIVATRELGIAFIAYSPLGRSLLGGKITDAAEVAADRRAQHPRFQGQHFYRNRQLADRVATIAAEKNCTPAQLSLAWLLGQGDDIIPIPGTKRKERFVENLGALLVRLTGEDLERLDEAFPPGAASGARYPEINLKDVYR